MLLYLDDERPCPDGWVAVKTSAEAINLLTRHRGEVDALSLDHDLGGDDTGYRVVTWLEEEVFLRGYPPPRLSIHSANPVGRIRMQQAIDNIHRFSGV
jgi:hypothetical protein